MNRALVDSLREQIVAAVTTGVSKFLVWGFTEETIGLISDLTSLGLGHSVVAVVGHFPDCYGISIFNQRVLAPSELANLNFDALVVTLDEDKEAALSEFASYDSRIPEVIIGGIKHFSFRDPAFDKILGDCLVKSYANGYEYTLIHIFQSIKFFAENNIRANVAEFGIFKGGTITFIAKTLAYFGFNNVEIYGFDIFEGFPKSRTIFDLYRNPKCEFKDYATVENYCRSMGIHIIKGDIVDTHRILLNVPLMLSFFDTDNYSPAKAALPLVYENTVKGGVIVFDHYISEERFIYTIGERMAASVTLEDKGLFNLQGTGVFLKVR